MTWTDEHFEELSWHDCHVWGLAVRAGDPDTNDWTSDFVLDIDFITEWVCSVDGGASFRVAPATLTFHGATNPEISVAWGQSGHQTAVHPMSIAGVTRERVTGQRVYLDRPYYQWRVALNWPAGGFISLGAVGFTQVLRAEPVLMREQQLPASVRRKDVFA